MFGLGMPELMIIVAVLVFVLVGFGLVRRRGRGIRISGRALVLKRFNIDETPTAKAVVDVVGRGSGIIAWFLPLWVLMWKQAWK